MVIYSQNTDGVIPELLDSLVLLHQWIHLINKAKVLQNIRRLRLLLITVAISPIGGRFQMGS